MYVSNMTASILKMALAAAVLAALNSCSGILLPEEEITDTRIPLNLEVSVPGMVLSKSPVSGAEGVFGMQLICFDENGLYTGLGSASFTPPSGGATSGSLAGSVPGGTCCIHFIANAGLVPEAAWKSMHEIELIGNLRSDASSTHIMYWGCHREPDPGQMAVWLGSIPRNTIRLLRDRAKITLEEPDTSWDHSSDPSVTEHILSMRFAVCNGRTEGMVAPFDKSTLSFDYDAPLTLPSGHLRYSGDASQLIPCTGEQFLFEDENTLGNSVKVILETTYSRGTGGQTTETVKYHQVMLMSGDYSLYEVRRNHQYNIIVVNLPSALAYDSFQEALDGSPSNNQTVLVTEIVPQINSEDCSFSIQGGTTHIIQKDSGGPQFADIDFSFMKNGAPDPQTDASGFSAEWLSNLYLSYADAPLAIDAVSGRPGYFRMRVPLYQPITNDLKAGKILLRDTRYGLSRFINIYSITAFDFRATLEATSVPGTPFILSFTIPDNYPSSLFPFKVKILTEALSPTSAQNAEKALGVEVRETYPRYGVSWNFCYTYEVFRSGTYTVSFKSLDTSVSAPAVILDADHFGTLDAQGERILDYVRIN